MTEKVNITYETLFDILRLEKNTGELQKLKDSFYQDVFSYFNSKKEVLQREESMFSETDKEKTLIQIQNIKRLLKELYEKRERKIIELAINKSRTGSDILDLSALLPQEKKIFSQLVKIFSSYREEILNNIMNGKQPTLNESIGKQILHDKEDKNYTEKDNNVDNADLSSNGYGEKSDYRKKKYDDNKEDEDNNDIKPKDIEDKDGLDDKSKSESYEGTRNTDSGNADTNLGNADSEDHESEESKKYSFYDEEKEDDSKKEETKTVKFIHPVPKFLGRELEVYGPFDSEDIAKLPLDIANILIRKGRAHGIEEQ